MGGEDILKIPMDWAKIREGRRQATKLLSRKARFRRIAEIQLVRPQLFYVRPILHAPSVVSL